jgi:hypothetical protein
MLVNPTKVNVNGDRATGRPMSRSAKHSGRQHAHFCFSTLHLPRSLRQNLLDFASKQDTIHKPSALWVMLQGGDSLICQC